MHLGSTCTWLLPSGLSKASLKLSDSPSHRPPHHFASASARATPAPPPSTSPAAASPSWRRARCPLPSIILHLHLRRRCLLYCSGVDWRSVRTRDWFHLLVKYHSLLRCLVLRIVFSGISSLNWTIKSTSFVSSLRRLASDLLVSWDATNPIHPLMVRLGSYSSACEIDLTWPRTTWSRSAGAVQFPTRKKIGGSIEYHVQRLSFLLDGVILIRAIVC